PDQQVQRALTACGYQLHVGAHGKARRKRWTELVERAFIEARVERHRVRIAHETRSNARLAAPKPCSISPSGSPRPMPTEIEPCLSLRSTATKRGPAS